ncbi:hypothetical protein A3D06_00135 [Candidatus Roizmanbacteria bacterium RIFCSPHIGHO2_02_FULL_40_9]|uniref:ComEC/Rec2-related protein domain-containing protein n=2 Tax=Candidatus Roizmaniibacteriota TaxID=1752723 RepID=A0A1F7ILX4_9BACT|nr:MAG: hypothetical protein A3D06_00135 [Candidatus Roizmanbacteria bacterium RIFCSPHIGHO2_02_FULL_40_9]OGK44353.1 MAG: hypothetical protein A2957_00165 [Candidatus Roizmanbacteria bacterium RIFCSPLOWO2_01_FULL_38_11]
MIDYIISTLSGYFPHDEGSLLAGMIFGKDINRYSELYEMFKKVGLLHIVVLSGTNISLFLSLTLSLLSFAGKKVSRVLSIIVVIAFIYLIGFDPPSVRALMSGSIQQLSILSGRKSYPLYVLFFSAVLIFIFKNEWIWSLSFQLSYAASLGIILFNRKSKPSSKFREYLSSELRLIFSAQLFTAPIIFFHFREISLISPLANLLVGFVVGPIMLLGLFTSVCAFINPYLAYIPARFLHLFLGYILFITKKLSSIPFAYVKL